MVVISTFYVMMLNIFNATVISTFQCDDVNILHVMVSTFNVAMLDFAM